jgi:hypothetical protein
VDLRGSAPRSRPCKGRPPPSAQARSGAAGSRTRMSSLPRKTATSRTTPSWTRRESHPAPIDANDRPCLQDEPMSPALRRTVPRESELPHGEPGRTRTFFRAFGGHVASHAQAHVGGDSGLEPGAPPTSGGPIHSPCGELASPAPRMGAAPISTDRQSARDSWSRHEASRKATFAFGLCERNRTFLAALGKPLSRQRESRRWGDRPESNRASPDSQSSPFTRKTTTMNLVVAFARCLVERERRHDAASTAP